MFKLKEKLKKLPPYKERPHLYKKWLWVLLAVPTVLWWSDSILWVLIISIYANIETSDGADEAMLAKKAQENAESNNPSI